MASTLLEADTEAPADAESQTSEPDESTKSPAPDAEGKPSGDSPAEGEADDAPDKDSEEGQDDADSAAPKDEEVSYDALALGDDSPLSEEYVEGVIEFATANDMPAETAQALLSRDEARAIAADATWADTVEGWGKDFAADKEFGGENLDRSVANARAAMSKFGPEGFIEQLNESGFGNHPGLLRFAATVGSKMAEADKMVSGSKASNDGKPTWNTLFPESGDLPSADAT